VPAETTVIVAVPERAAALREGLRLPGRVLPFTTSNLVAAFESIRSCRPKLVVLDALFAPTAQGRAFSDRVTSLLIASGEIQLVALVRGVWTITGTNAEPGIRAASVPAADAQQAGLNTRRAPRFPVVDLIEAVIEGYTTPVVNMSIFGAQVVSEPALRPNQRIKVALPDVDDTLRLTAHVAWSVFERPTRAEEPRYRAGMEFDSPMAPLLEDYCRRHRLEKPLGRAIP
jgi:hypothetical protein